MFLLSVSYGGAMVPRLFLLIISVHQADIAQGLDVLVPKSVCALGMLAGSKIADAALRVGIDDLQGAGGIDHRKIPQ